MWSRHSGPRAGPQLHPGHGHGRALQAHRPGGGCSGSPVYIDGRLAGALALGWTFSKDPLYGVTPIEEMLEVGLSRTGPAHRRSPCRRRGPDVRFLQADQPDRSRQAAYGPGSSWRLPSSSGATALPCPLLISGLPSEACQHLAGPLEAMGFMAVPGLSGSLETKDETTADGPRRDPDHAPGHRRYQDERARDGHRGPGRVHLRVRPQLPRLRPHEPADGQRKGLHGHLQPPASRSSWAPAPRSSGAITADESGAIFGRDRRQAAT